MRKLGGCAALAVACSVALTACGGGGGERRLPRATGFTVPHPLRLGPRPRPAPTAPTLVATDETSVVAVTVPGGRIRTLLRPGTKRDPVTVSSPAWAPDGRSFIAATGFGPDRRAVVVDLAGGRRRTLPRSLAGGSFSPDGRYILAARGFGLYAYDLRRGRSVQVVGGPVADGATVAWSPDGRRIALDRDRGGIVVVDLARRSVGVLARDGSAPAWSPDGRRIAFATTRGVGARRCGEDGCLPTSEIDVVQSDGGGRRRLTRTTGDEWSPAWSPDGRLVAAQLRGGRTDYDGEFGLVTFGPDGRCYRTLVSVGGHVLGLGPGAWRPGSRPVAAGRC